MPDLRYEPAGRGAKARRDTALRRVNKVTTRIAVATVAAVGILGLYVSRALPGHAAAPPSSSTTGSTSTTTPTTTVPAASGTSGSSSPQTTPAPPPSPPTTTAPQRVHVSTGAS